MKACVSHPPIIFAVIKSRSTAALLQYVASTLSAQISSSPFVPFLFSFIPSVDSLLALSNARSVWSEDTTFPPAGCGRIASDAGLMSNGSGRVRENSTRLDSEAYTDLLQVDEANGEAAQKEVGGRGGLDRGCL